MKFDSNRIAYFTLLAALLVGACSRQEPESENEEVTEPAPPPEEGSAEPAFEPVVEPVDVEVPEVDLWQVSPEFRIGDVWRHDVRRREETILTASRAGRLAVSTLERIHEISYDLEILDGDKWDLRSFRVEVREATERHRSGREPMALGSPVVPVGAVWTCQVTESEPQCEGDGTMPTWLALSFGQWMPAGGIDLGRTWTRGAEVATGLGLSFPTEFQAHFEVVQLNEGDQEIAVDFELDGKIRQSAFGAEQDFDVSGRGALTFDPTNDYVRELQYTLDVRIPTEVNTMDVAALRQRRTHIEATVQIHPVE